MWLLFSFPAIYAHIINGVFLLVALVLFVRYYNRLTPSDMLIASLLASIAVGIHGISHIETGGLLRMLYSSTGDRQ